MHHYRVNLSGPPGAIREVAAEMGQSGDATTLIVACDEGIDFWESLSRQHPRVTFGIEWFEAFEDELLRAVVRDGETTEMARDSVLPNGWGSYQEEDGDPIDDNLLRAAAESVAEHRLAYEMGTNHTALATAVSMGKALGRLCSRVEETLHTDSPGDALDAVVELAVFALRTSVVGSALGPEEREFAHALALTQSMLHAKQDEFWDGPGNADWDEWLQRLIGSASNVIDAATHIWIGPQNDLHALGSEHHSTPTEQLESEAHGLLTTCIQALAMFGDAHRSAV